MRGNDAAATVGGANGQGRQGEPRKPQVDQEETAVGAAGAGAVAGAACVNKKNPKVLTYSKEHSVLICGDGDFSFTRGVIRHRGTGLGVVATSFDSRKTVLKKYPRAKSWLPQLDEDGAQVLGVESSLPTNTSVCTPPKIRKGKKFACELSLNLFPHFSNRVSTIP